MSRRRRTRVGAISHNGGFKCGELHPRGLVTCPRINRQLEPRQRSSGIRAAVRQRRKRKIVVRPLSLPSVSDEYRSASDQNDTEPIDCRKPFAQENDGEDRKKDHA